jgi:hypothetical protein
MLQVNLSFSVSQPSKPSAMASFRSIQRPTIATPPRTYRVAEFLFGAQSVFPCYRFPSAAGGLEKKVPFDSAGAPDPRGPMDPATASRDAIGRVRRRIRHPQKK